VNRLIQSFSFATNLSDGPDQSLVKAAENYIRLFEKNRLNSDLRESRISVRKRREDPDLKRVDL